VVGEVELLDAEDELLEDKVVAVAWEDAWAEDEVDIITNTLAGIVVVKVTVPENHRKTYHKSMSLLVT
jgi:hypothetical protein